VAEVAAIEVGRAGAALEPLPARSSPRRTGTVEVLLVEAGAEAAGAAAAAGAGVD